MAIERLCPAPSVFHNSENALAYLLFLVGRELVHEPKHLADAREARSAVLNYIEMLSTSPACTPRSVRTIEQTRDKTSAVNSRPSVGRGPTRPPNLDDCPSAETRLLSRPGDTA
jgi:hypothetical protein